MQVPAWRPSLGATILVAASLTAYTLLGYWGVAQLLGYIAGLAPVLVIGEAASLPVMLGLFLPGVAAATYTRYPRASGLIAAYCIAGAAVISIYELAAEGLAVAPLAVATILQLLSALLAAYALRRRLGWEVIAVSAVILALASPLPAAFKFALRGPVGDLPEPLISVIESMGAAAGASYLAWKIGARPHSAISALAAASALTLVVLTAVGEIGDATAAYLCLPFTAASVVAVTRAIMKGRRGLPDGGSV